MSAAAWTSRPTDLQGDALKRTTAHPQLACARGSRRRYRSRTTARLHGSGFSQDARTCACAQSSAYVSDNTATRPVQPPLGQLERALIEEFVRTRGYDPSRLGELADQEREKLLSEASSYASAKLMEVEARSHFLEELHDPSA